MILRVISRTADIHLFVFGKPAILKEEAAELKELFLSRRLIHTVERKLYLLVSGSYKRRGTLVHEHPFDIVGVLFHSAKKSVAPRSIVVSASRLHKMSRAIKLVPIAAAPARLGLYDSKVDIEISVLTLIFLYLVYKALYLFFKIGAVLLSHNVSRTLHPFRNVGVPEEMRLLVIALLPLELEGVYSAGLKESVVHGVYRNLAVKLLYLLPEAATESYVTIIKIHIVLRLFLIK